MSTSRDVWLTWLQAAGIRMVRTGAQVAIAAIGSAALLSQVKWGDVTGVVSLSMILSGLTSLAGLPEAPSPLKTPDP
jgi:hypothetical protein